MANNTEKNIMPDLERMKLRAKVIGKPFVIIVGADKAEMHDLPPYGKYEINTHNNEITNHNCIESRKW